MDEKLTYEKLIEMVDLVKICSGCDKVKFIGTHETFEEIIAMGFPLNSVECERVFELDESQLYIIPIE